MKKFSMGQNSLEVCQVIVSLCPEIFSLELIQHPVGINWRQAHPNNSDKARDIIGSFNHKYNTRKEIYNRDNFLELNLGDLPKLPENNVWSITSKISCYDNKCKHIPMMNFHPEGIRLETIIEVLNNIVGKRGVVLDSGRYYHYYGDFLIEEKDWIKFIGDFLAPCVLVSPRYIFHRLKDGYCSLRLTSDKQYKPKIPEVVSIL